MLFAGPDHQDQAVIVLKIFFYIHPVQVFDAHIVSPIHLMWFETKSEPQHLSAGINYTFATGQVPYNTCNAT
jgi:hypothetical protein